MIVLIMISSIVYQEYNQFFFIKRKNRNSMVVQWLRLHASTVGDTSSIPGPRTKIPQAAQCSQKKKKKRIIIANINCNFVISQTILRTCLTYTSTQPYEVILLFFSFSRHGNIDTEMLCLLSIVTQELKI